MALSDRAAVLVPYVQRLLYDEEAQDAVRRVVAGRGMRTGGLEARPLVGSWRTRSSDVGSSKP